MRNEFRWGVADIVRALASANGSNNIRREAWLPSPQLLPECRREFPLDFEKFFLALAVVVSKSTQTKLLVAEFYTFH
jgi:hypothetical protein